MWCILLCLSKHTVHVLKGQLCRAAASLNFLAAVQVQGVSWELKALIFCCRGELCRDPLTGSYVAWMHQVRSELYLWQYVDRVYFVRLWLHLALCGFNPFPLPSGLVDRQNLKTAEDSLLHWFKMNEGLYYCNGVKVDGKSIRVWSPGS